MPSLRSRSSVAVGLLLAGAAATLLVPDSSEAHPDDPKLRDRMPRYEGPGWRASRDAARPPLAGGTFEAENVTLESWVSLPELGGASSGNDCWGYVSQSGREYAIMGTSEATAFVEVTDPTAPSIVGSIPGPVSSWRDVKTYDQYAYAVSEGGNGIQVIDLGSIDAGSVSLVATITTGGTTATHNVAIDETSGRLYRTGGGPNGLRIYDLTADPTQPTFLGQWGTKYVHDAQVITRPDGTMLAYCLGGFNGGWEETGLTIVDVTDPTSPVVLGEATWPDAQYSHQGWLSEDGDWFFINDELDEDGIQPSTTIVIDVQDVTQPRYVSEFDNGLPAITHNCYVVGDLLYCANYRSGLRVFDVGDPLAPEEVAYFDTFPTDDNASFNGLWSVYPYLPSGTVIGSDIERGLFVWTVEPPKLVFEYPDGRPDLLSPGGDEVVVAIVEETTGDLVPGTERLVYSVAGAPPVEVPLDPQGGGTYAATFPSLECSALVEWYVAAENVDGDVERSPRAGAGAPWEARVADSVAIAFSDDGETDPGWSVVNVDLSDGAWDRGVPVGGGDRGDPATDFDGSGRCWLTDNEDDNSDVDGGPTRLTSPALDASGLNDPWLEYAWWFTNDDNDADRLRVELSDDDGASWTVVTQHAGTAIGWQTSAWRLSDWVTPSATVRVRFSATDNPNDSVTEAGIDAVRLFDYVCDPAVPGDVTGDGAVDFADLLALLAAWGTCEPGEPCPADVDEDGVVGFEDLLIVLAAFGG